MKLSSHFSRFLLFSDGWFGYKYISQGHWFSGNFNVSRFLINVFLIASVTSNASPVFVICDKVYGNDRTCQNARIFHFVSLCEFTLVLFEKYNSCVNITLGDGCLLSLSLKPFTVFRSAELMKSFLSSDCSFSSQPERFYIRYQISQFLRE